MCVWLKSIIVAVWVNHELTENGCLLSTIKMFSPELYRSFTHTHTHTENTISLPSVLIPAGDGVHLLMNRPLPLVAEHADVMVKCTRNTQRLFWTQTLQAEQLSFQIYNNNSNTQNKTVIHQRGSQEEFWTRVHLQTTIRFFTWAAATWSRQILAPSTLGAVEYDY